MKAKSYFNSYWVGKVNMGVSFYVTELYNLLFLKNECMHWADFLHAQK